MRHIFNNLEKIKINLEDKTLFLFLAVSIGEYKILSYTTAKIA